MKYLESFPIYESEQARQEREIARLEAQLKLLERECVECEDTHVRHKLETKLAELKKKHHSYTDIDEDTAA